MDRRRICHGICLATMIVAGCESSPNPASHELVETPPVTKHVVQKLETPPATEASKPAVQEITPASTPKPVEAPAVASATTDAVRPADVATVATSPSAVPMPSATGLPMAPGQPNKIELLIPNKEFKRIGKEKALKVTFDDVDLLKVLNMAPVPLDAPKYFPDWLSGLNGQTIRIRGFMYPMPIEEGITSFLFMRDKQTCCFGPNAKIYDKMAITMRDGETTNYIQNRPFDVIGKLRIEPEEQDGSLLLLYFIDDAVVIGG